MANKDLFKSRSGCIIPRTDTVNAAGGRAYKFSDPHALAQYAATGCLNNTYYTSAGKQLDKVLELCESVSPKFIAKTAVYTREQSFMKDMPALLCAVLASKEDQGLPYLKAVFPRVIDNAKMLRNFVQIVRSGVTGRKSFGTAVKKLITNWFDSKSPDTIFRGTVGKNPSMADIIKMVHPRPKTPTKEALYGYILGKAHNKEALPQLVREYEQFKAVFNQDINNYVGRIPKVPFQMIAGIQGISERTWQQIALDGGWHMIRMNLNTFQRHGVFENDEVTDRIVEKLTDKELISKSKVFPYQLLIAYIMTGDVPVVIQNALQDALEIATKNVPAFNGKTIVCVDTSGSMYSPVTGDRRGSTTAVTCVDVAGLIASTILRQNSDAVIIPFDTRVREVRLNPRDSVMTNARKLRLGGGGTACSVALEYANSKGLEADQVIYVSDNESWVDSKRSRGRWSNDGTRTMEEWRKFQKRNKNAKLVCIDIQPHGDTQAPDNKEVLNIGGFSDTVFNVVKAFTDGETNSFHWTEVINNINIE